jgi:NTP pyrophosphatase (non-canonical NTP hydrolase)
MNILKDIYKIANAKQPHYDERYLNRRVTKMSEETGECSQAFLSVTSEENSKNKTFTDVREEAVDAAIVSLDVAMTRFPGEENLSEDEIIALVEAMVSKKLKKWVKKVKKKQDTI